MPTVPLYWNLDLKPLSIKVVWSAFVRSRRLEYNGSEKGWERERKGGKFTQNKENTSSLVPKECYSPTSFFRSP